MNGIVFMRYYLIFLCSYFCVLYCYIKMINKPISKSDKIIVLFFLAIIPSIFSIMRMFNLPFYRFFFCLVTSLSIVFLKRDKYYKSIPIIIISIGITYAFETASIILLVIICYLFKYYDTNIITETITSLLEFILVFLFTKIKRIKNGFTFFDDKNNFGIGILISGPIIILTSIQKEQINDWAILLIIFGITISSIGLFLWIRSAFKRYYRKKLKKRAEEYSKIELAEKDKEIEKLINETTSLSSIIHLDNYLINELETTLKNKNDETINHLLALSKQRNEFVNNKIINDKLLPTTGNTEIDTVITDIYIKAASRGIDYNLNIGCDINYLLNNIITKDDFEILLRNTITTSIVDIENNPEAHGRIVIKISQPNDIYELTITDNGINTYDINSISEIIKKSNASTITNKFDNNDSFTKAITIRFDGLNNNTQ